MARKPVKKKRPAKSHVAPAAVPTEHSRFEYSAIVDRPPLRLPNGGRVIVWTIINLEVWDISRPMPRTAMPAPSGQTMLPDVTNWAWHEYGMRIGVWRFFKLFEQLGIRLNAQRFHHPILLEGDRSWLDIQYVCHFLH